jgi:RNA polymerase sigma-70 factor, ECF subfamily
MGTSGFSGLLAAARSGDDDAFRMLCRPVAPTLARYLRVMAPDRVDELAAATWSRVIPKLPRFRGDEAQWRLLVLKAARCRVRRARRRAVPRPAARAHTLAGEITRTALRLLAALPALEAESLLLRTAGGLSPNQAAEVTRQTPGGARAAAHRGLARAGVLAASPAIRRRIDDGLPAGEPIDWMASAGLPAPPVADAMLEQLFAGQAVSPGAPRRWHELAAIVTALRAPPTADELAGADAALEIMHRRRERGRQRVRPTIRFGSRVAMTLAAVSILLPGALTAAYAGVLPDWLQSVAHQWLDAPQRPGHGVPATPAHNFRSPSTRVVEPRDGRARGHAHRAAVSHGPKRTAPGRTKAPHPTVTPPGSTRTPPNPKKAPPGRGHAGR